MSEPVTWFVVHRRTAALGDVAAIRTVEGEQPLGNQLLPTPLCERIVAEHNALLGIPTKDLIAAARHQVDVNRFHQLEAAIMAVRHKQARMMFFGTARRKCR